jgi:hypothetical protein
MNQLSFGDTEFGFKMASGTRLARCDSPKGCQAVVGESDSDHGEVAAPR